MIGVTTKWTFKNLKFARRTIRVFDGGPSVTFYSTYASSNSAA
jgi:hypothetical protein